MQRSMFSVASVALLAMTLAAVGSVRAAETKSGAAMEVGGKVLAAYLEMGSTLAADSLAGVTERATKIAADAGAAAGKATGAEKAALESLAAAAGKVTGAEIAALRAQFKDLSRATDAYLRATATPGWSLYYCPMADAYWLQAAEPVANPYYGKAMLRCGDRVEKVEG